jgi:hypothetical protein
MIEAFDPSMNIVAIIWNNEIGIPLIVPKSQENVDQRS